jgi:hypothetical protein
VSAQSNATTVPQTPIPIQQCDLPFTYNGNLYYTCISNVSGVTTGNQVACPNTNGNWMLCTLDPTFNVTNTTKSLAIPTTSTSIQAMSVNGWIIIQQRLDATLNWSVNWSTYKAGFGALGNSYWMGNENVHLLTTSATYRLRMEALSVNNGWISTEYGQFSLDNETSKYKLHVAGYVPWDGGDVLRYNGSGTSYYQNGMNFSTYDNDYDNSPGLNCATQSDGGFWFNNCFEVCLTCTYTSQFAWYTLPSLPLLTQSRMMIKPA